MAGYMCDSQDDQAADVLVTNLDNGDTLALCSTCFLAWIDAMKAELERQAQADGAQGPVMPATAEKEGEAAPSTPSPKRRRTRPQTAQATPQNDQAPDQVPSIDPG
jgi:hypothetical protein